MSRTQYYCASSLDGYIAEADDTIEWLERYEGSYDGPDADRMEGGYDRFYDAVGAMVMGSATYEFVLRHMAGGGSWPYGGKPSWVLTTRDLPTPGDEDVRIGSGDVAELHAEMMSTAGGRNLWVVGGGNVASQFADAGLLDELLLTVVPVALGSGKPLFERRLPGPPMQLTGTRAFENGMVELRYELQLAR